MVLTKIRSNISKLDHVDVQQSDNATILLEHVIIKQNNNIIFSASKLF